MAIEQIRMRHPDNKELVPRFLVQAMFALMIGTIALAAFARLTNRPMEGVLERAPIAAERQVILTGERSGLYVVTDAATGAQIALSSDDKAGFIGVMGRMIDRARQLGDIKGNDPVRVVRREDGHIAIIDDKTGMAVEVTGYGADNAAAFARIVDWNPAG
ncbi:MAG: photosynthetic complex assembly protein PuhC [Rhodobacterales bacterium]|jgi:putative photosynthetic complex assembly protein|nr:photosynthetic complex assembly protein PuhC [Rhodobacterales bacterium]